MPKTDDELAQLLKAVGKRSEPAPEVTEKIRQTTHAAWLQAVQAAKTESAASLHTANGNNAVKTKRWPQPWLTAAVVVAGFMALLVTQQLAIRGDAKPVVAQFILREGDVVVAPLLHEQVIHSGATLTTRNNSLVAIQLTDNTKITLASNTQIEVVNAGLINIKHGRIYIDSPDANTSIIVATPMGEIVDIGTQYEVDVSPDNMAVTMREGVTKITLEGKTLYGRVADGFGDAIRVDAQRNVRNEKIATTDEHWQWTQKAIPDFNLHNASAHDVLHWASRVTGKTIIYATPQVQRTAEQTHLSGGFLAASSIGQTLPSIFKTTTLHINEQRQALFITQE